MSRPAAAHPCICLIPHYRDQAGLLRSLQSFSTADPCDVLVVNDGPPQLDVAQLREAFAGDGQVHVLESPHNEGIEYALNRGLRWILDRDYTYIARLDAGDTVLPGRFALQMRALRETPGLMLVGGAARVLDVQTGRSWTRQMPTDREAILRAMYRNNAFIHPCVMLRRELLREGLYPLDYPAAEDYAWFWSVAQRHPVANLPQELIVYELAAGSISVRRRHRQLRSRWRLQWRQRRASRASLGGMALTLLQLLLPAFVWRTLKRDWWRR